MNTFYRPIKNSGTKTELGPIFNSATGAVLWIISNPIDVRGWSWELITN